ncbi:MAG: diadenylate cyclase [Candidatus Obscuribacterales bacterium]
MKPTHDFKRAHSQILQQSAANISSIQRRHIKVQRLLHALSQGLSQFFGDRTITSKFDPKFRVAGIVRAKPDEPVYVYDPNDLLADFNLELPKAIAAAEAEIASVPASVRKPYEPFLLQEWYINVPDVCGLVLAADTVPLVGIIVESPPLLSSQDAIKEWIGATGRIACERLHNEIFSYPDTASMAMRSYAMESVVGALQRMADGVPDNSIQVQSIIESLCEISTHTEEGKRPTGILAVVQQAELDKLTWKMQLHDQQRPRLEESKHISKLFALCDGRYALITDGTEVYGLANILERPPNCIFAEFSNGRAAIFFNDIAVAVLANGSLHAPFSPPEHILRETLEELPDGVTDNCIQALLNLVAQARRLGHGTTLVIHRGSFPERLSGSEVKHPLPVDQLTSRMCEIDGAVILDSSLQVRAFGCLLDGMVDDAENRARGSRYNSALRYTRLHGDAVVVVVSSDGPVSVFVNGEDLTIVSPPVDKPTTVDPPTLERFLQEQEQKRAAPAP